jgi:miniconductance mechanosensitive channel
VCSVLDGLYSASEEEIGLKDHPLDGLLQMLKLITVSLGIIVAISLLLNKNPSAILAGLGASAAVLMLVFKDTILGFVAGIQLSFNKMLNVGDWITIPSRNVNGIVEQVSLTTVKVRNYDNTILTVPPYTLVSESFQNWRGMQDRGGRRVMRSINIDMNTVRFCTDEEMQRYASLGWLDGMETTNGKQVNLKIFRHYLEKYLTNHPGIIVNTEEKMLLMVRQLQPTPQGLPLELYFFSASVDWVPYEQLQADVFDHLIAVVKEFGLKIYQAPSGDDLLNISLNQQLKQS